MQPHQSNQSMHSQQHIQQMQQMHQHLQAQMQHQSAGIGAPHSGASMSPAGLGTNTGQSMMSSNRPLGNMHQNFPQLMPHQMYPQAMGNPQVQQSQNMMQQAQAQMGSHQPDHSKAQQQQQQQAALYWNAMAAKKNKPAILSRSQSLTSPSLGTDSQLMQQQQQQRASQQIPNIPSGRLVAPRITPMNQPSVGSAVGPAQDVSSMSNAGLLENKNMSHEQMLLLRQQQIIAELQSQIQQITGNGGNPSRSRSQSSHASQLGISNLNQNANSSFNDVTAQQVNVNMNSQANNQLQQMGQNGTFPMYGGLNPGNQKMERKNSLLNHQQHQLGVSSNMHSMMTGSASSLLSDSGKVSDFGQDPLQHSGGSKQQQQQFMNSLGGNAMNQTPNALMQNQLFQNNMKQQQRRTSHDSMLGLQGMQSQQQGRGNFNFFNNRKSIQPSSQMQRSTSSGAKNISVESDDLKSNLQEDDLLLQLQMSQNILNSNSNDSNNKGDDLDDDASQKSSSKSALDRKSSKRKNSASNGNKIDQNLKKRNADISSKSLKNHGRGKNAKRKLNNDADEVDSGGADALKLSLSDDRNALTGGWQSHDDIPDRRRMIVCVVKVIEQMRPDASKISHKFPLMAKKLEEHLYRSASSKEEYTNFENLKRRLQMIAHALGIHKISDQEDSLSLGDDLLPLAGDLGTIDFSDGKQIKSNGEQNKSEDNLLSDTFEVKDMKSKNTPFKDNQDLVLPSQSIPEQQPSVGPLNHADNFFPDPSSIENLKNKKQGNLIQMQESLNMLKKKQKLGMRNSDSSLLPSQGPDDVQQHNQPSGFDVFDMNGQFPNRNPSQVNSMIPPMRPTSNNSIFGGMNQLMLNPQQSDQSGNQSGTDFPSQMKGNSLQHANQQKLCIEDPVGSSQTMNTHLQQGLGSSNSMLSSQSRPEAANVQRKKQIRLQQQRLLLLRHASKCTKGDKCKTPYCRDMVALWRHIKKCTDRYCATPHCLSSRCVLNHYRICKKDRKSATCEVCAPVIRRTRTEAADTVDNDIDQIDQIDQFGKDQDANRMVGGDKSLSVKLSDLDGSDNMLPKINNGVSPLLQNQQFNVPQMPSSSQLQMQAPSIDQQFSTQGGLNYNSSEQDSKLHHQHLLLQQLRQQQAQLFEQQKHIQQQQQHAPPNSAKAEQLNQQVTILFTLQQQISHQQRILQHVVQEQTSNNNNSSLTPFDVFKPNDTHDTNSVSSFMSTVTEKTKNPMKRKSKDKEDDSSQHEGNGKISHGKRLSASHKANKKVVGKDLRSQRDKVKPTKAKAKKNTSETTNGDKKKKTSVTKKKTTSNKELKEKPQKGVESNKDNQSFTDTLNNEENNPSTNEGDNSLIMPMSADPAQEHIDSITENQITAQTITEKCLPVIEKLMSDKYGWVFRDPVDPVELGIPDYFSIVTNPMDLSLVKKKLEDGVYSDLETFAKETKLIFENAMLYNGEESDVGDMAKSLIAMFVEEFNPVMQEFTR